MFKYTSPGSPSHTLLFLGLPNKRGASRIRHIWVAVGSFWDFTADVMGAIGVACVTRDVVAVRAVGSVSVLGDVGATSSMLQAPGESWVLRSS